MPTPDFILAGAAKCGTTALWHHLDAHPGVGMTYIKEPRFFTREEGGLERGVVDASIPRSGTYDRGLDWYRELWRDAPPGAVLGEASTVYAVAPDAPALIRAHVPDVRLILMVRDPVDRMYSHYWQEQKAGSDLGDFRVLVAQEHPRIQYYQATSHYRAIVERFLAEFGRDQLLLLAKEDLDAEPARVLAEVFAFVGVDPAFRPDALGRRFNKQRLPRYPWLRRLADRARATVGARLPHGARQALGRTQRGIERRLSTPLDYPPLDPDLRAELLPRFQDDIAFVEAWLGRPRPAWRAVGEPRPAPSARPSGASR